MRSLFDGNLELLVPMMEAWEAADFMRLGHFAPSPSLDHARRMLGSSQFSSTPIRGHPIGHAWETGLTMLLDMAKAQMDETLAKWSTRQEERTATARRLAEEEEHRRKLRDGEVREAMDTSSSAEEERRVSTRPLNPTQARSGGRR